MSKKQTTVAVSGAFDPLHIGHMRYMREAAKLGDRLIVILNSDEFLLRKKGFIFMPFEDRKEILESIKGVDEVVASIDTDQTVSKTLELIKPDIFAKGREPVSADEIPEVETCRLIGCEVVMNVGGGKVRGDRELSWKVKDLGLEEVGKLSIVCQYCDDHPILREKCQHCKGTGKVEVGKQD
jgi:D-beta-D-heptose 7-phosphate kinase/D-beta-D-heptose 1-phosphate adenosyltransferase